MSYLASLDPDLLKKTILKPGNGEKDAPRRFDQVSLLFKLTTSDGQLVEEANDPEKPFQIKVGDADLMKGFNLALTTMREGETAIFEIPEDLCCSDNDQETPGENEQKEKKVDLILKATLLSINTQTKVTKWDLCDHEKFDFAKSCKEEGNSLFKEGNWEEAEEKYSQAIEIIEWDKSPRRIDLKVSTLYNISQVLTKQKRFVSALERINWAINLKPEEAKGYFRKANVYFGMEEFERALEELYKAKKIEPSNPDIINEIKKVKEAQEQYRKSSSQLYSKMFGKSVFETRAKCDYSDDLDPIVEFEFTIGEFVLCLKLEVFQNILPDTASYFLALVKEGLMDGYISSDIKANNYLLFNSPQPEDSNFKNFLPDNTSNKVKSAGMLFFKPSDSDKTLRSEIGLSLAPLPWMDGKWIPFGFVCSPIDFNEKIDKALKNANVTSDATKDPVIIRLKNFKLCSPQ